MNRNSKKSLLFSVLGHVAILLLLLSSFHFATPPKKETPMEWIDLAPEMNLPKSTTALPPLSLPPPPDQPTEPPPQEPETETAPVVPPEPQPEPDPVPTPTPEPRKSVENNTPEPVHKEIPKKIIPKPTPPVKPKPVKKTPAKEPVKSPAPKPPVKKTVAKKASPTPSKSEPHKVKVSNTKVVKGASVPSKSSAPPVPLFDPNAFSKQLLSKLPDSEGLITADNARGTGTSAKGAEKSSAWYLNQVFQKMYSAWTAPLGMPEGLTSKVQIRIEKNGNISKVTLTGKSGNAALDASAVKAAQSVQKLPPPPEELGSPFVEITIHFKVQTS